MLMERKPIEHSFINDPKFSWSRFTVQNNRQDKLDELDLTMGSAGIRRYFRSEHAKRKAVPP
jgi:hypothetical protein